MGFQTVINQTPAPGIEGDFASDNPRATVLTDPAGGQLVVAATAPLTCGRFAWVVAGAVSNASPGGLVLPSGFVGRDMGGLLTVWLQEGSLSCVQPGYPCALYNWGDFFARPLNSVTIGQKVFANLATGQVEGGTAGATLGGFIGTASFATNQMTVVTSTGAPLAKGDVITSAGVTAGTYVTALTGTGGVGSVATLSTSPGTITTQAATSTGYIETQWNVRTACSAGEVAKISRIS